MKRSFLGIFITGLMAVGLLSFTDEYHPQEPQQKTTQQKESKRHHSKTETGNGKRTTDTTSPLQQPDTILLPEKDTKPLPDSIGRGMH